MSWISSNTLHEDGPIVLPRCLKVRCDMQYGMLARAETAPTDLRLIVARARRLADPELAAEWATFDAGDAPPWAK